MIDVLDVLGPWFRIFNISYPEISNCQEAAEKLCGKRMHIGHCCVILIQYNRSAESNNSLVSAESGYLHSFEPTREPYRNEIEEVLGVLTAAELREMSNITPLKVCIFSIPLQ